MLVALFFNVFAVAVAVLAHYEGLRLVSNVMPHVSVKPRTRILFIVGAVFALHLLEICFYAGGYMLMQYQWGIGALSGAVEGGWGDFFYFSAATYSTLGMGDITPLGAARSFAAVESLLGLVLIGWSTSFTYLAMRAFWDLHPDSGRKKRKRQE